MSIPIPPDLAEGRVTWTIGRGSSRALSAGRGTVRFRPSAVAVNFSTATVLPEPVETPVLAGVMTPVDLIQNDPAIWNWIVEPLLGVPWEPFPIDVDGPVDLSTAAQTPGRGPVRAVKGETGYSLTGEVRYQDGEVEFGIEDGSWTDPVTMPPGPPGPGNTLQIGTVSTSTAGGNAEASISGESPTQYLNLTLPRGDKPAITWQGSTIVVDGVPVQDLRGPKGDASTEPGPTGMSAYEYAVQAGFEGTEEEFATAVLPDDVSWAQITEKPDTYQPAAHQHDWADVTGTPATYPPATHSHAWADITGTPTSFPPAAHNHDTAYAAKPGEWIILTLLNGWAAYTGGGGYYKGLRARATPLGIQINGMVKGAGSGEIAIFPDSLGVPASAQWDARGAAGVSTLEVSEGSGSKPALKHRAGSPDQPAFLSVDRVLPLV